MPELPEAAQERPTEAQKKAAPTEHKTTGTFKTAGGHPDRKVDVVAKTTPNANGGYDTRLEMGIPK
jgi:hypothetical protein